MLVVDGSYFLHKSLYVEWSDVKSEDIITKFLCMLSNSCRNNEEECCDGIVVCWDLGVPLFRRMLWRNYKPAKTPRSWNIEEYLPNTKSKDLSETEILDIKRYYETKKFLHSEVLPRMGIVSIMEDDVEADDIVAFVVKISDKKKSVVIESSDRDLNQLLGENVKQIIGKGEELTLEKLIEEKKLVREKWRDHFLILKSLSGDKSDNVPKLLDKAGPVKTLEISLYILETWPEFSIEAISSKLTESQKAVINYLSEEKIRRNFDLVDLYYPYRNKSAVDFVHKIGRAFLRSCPVEEDVWTLQDLICDTGVAKRSNKLLSAIDYICDARSESMAFVEEIKEGTNKLLKNLGIS